MKDRSLRRHPSVIVTIPPRLLTKAGLAETSDGSALTSDQLLDC